LALAHVSAGDADGFHDAICADSDRYRVCGTSPIYATLALLGLRDLASTSGTSARRGELLSYAQCPADDGPVSWVSVAAVALY
jgi:hypothetical protein